MTIRLTTRGRQLIAAGLALSCLAVLLGEKDLIALGLLPIIAALGCALYLAARRLTITVEIFTTPQRTTAGTDVRLTVLVRNPLRRAHGPLSCHIDVPPSLAPPALAQLSGLLPGAVVPLARTITPARRGRYLVGPTYINVTDPLGLLERQYLAAAPQTLLVTPATVDLPAAYALRGSDDIGESFALLTGSEPDATLRPYHEGDDARTIHWRSSARRSDLVVRHTHGEVRPHAQLIVDTRRASWTTGDDFEAAIRAAASVATRLAADDITVDLAGSDSHDVLADLATLARSDQAQLPALVNRPSLLIYIGAVSVDDATQLVDAGAGTAAALTTTAASQLHDAGWRVGQLSDGPVSWWESVVATR